MNYSASLAALNAQCDHEILRLRAAGLTYDLSRPIVRSQP